MTGDDQGTCGPSPGTGRARTRWWVIPALVALLATTIVVTTASGTRGDVVATRAATTPAAVDPAVTIHNLDASGKQTLRFDTNGNAVDAHDGLIAQFTYQGQTRYYWYGTSADCGLGWLRTSITGGSAPWCGFLVYSSDDLRTWTYEGAIASGEDPVWQSRCDYASCWRPKVVYDPNTNLYVAWADTLLPPSGYSAWTSPTPVGPWTYRGNPTVTTNAGGSLVNQDESLFVDDDGTGYVVITDAARGYRPTVEKLNPDFLSSTGETSAIPLTGAEAPTIVKHGGRYFMLVSHPNGGFGHTGTAYLWADDPVGTWNWGGVLSTDTFGGQPTHAAAWQTTDGRTVYVFQADLWRRRYLPSSWSYPNQGLAGYSLTPLEFSAANVPSLPVAPQWTENLRFVDTGASPNLLPGSVAHAADGADWYQSCDVRSGTSRSFTFVAPRSGVLTGIRVDIVRSEYPNADGQLTLTDDTAPGRPTLATTAVPAYGAGWSPRAYTWTPDVQVEAGRTYRVALRSNDTNIDYSCYGFVYTAGSSAIGAASVAYGFGPWTPTGETVRVDLGIQDSLTGGSTVNVAPRRLTDRTVPGPYGARVQVTGVDGVPTTGLQAAWVNVTVDHPSSAGTLEVYPSDGTVGANVVRYQPGEVRAYSMLVRLGADGSIRLSSSATTRVVVDLGGWVTTPGSSDPGRLTVLPAAARAVDTRTNGTSPGPGGIVHVPLASAGVPADATAVLVNLTGAAPTTDTYLAAFPSGTSWDGTSTINLVAGEVARSNRTLVQVGAGRSIDVLNQAGRTGVVVDVVGYVTPAGGTSGLLVPLDGMSATPVGGLVGGTQAFSTDVGALRPVTGRPSATAVLVGLGIDGADLPGFLTAYRGGTPRPPTSDLNFPAGPRATYNLSAVPVDATGVIDLYANVPGGTRSLSLLGYLS